MALIDALFNDILEDFTFVLCEVDFRVLFFQSWRSQYEIIRHIQKKEGNLLLVV